jgi:beta-lactamase superfamily II metal-dependent hydrolase
MAAQHAINVDLAEITDAPQKGKFLTILAWGDAVEVLDITSKHVEVRTFKFEKVDEGFKAVPSSGFIVPPKSLKPSDVVIKRNESRVLKFNFVDVQQGDGSVIETPKGKVILIDGGDNVMFSRYLAARFRGSTETKPREIDCVLVTHGDADHFAGLTEIFRSETNANRSKRLFIHPRRVYHNGLVKRPSRMNGKAVKETELLGETRTVGDPETGKDVLLITGLETDLLKVADEQMNRPFLDWKRALAAWKKRGPIQFRRLEKGDDDAFDFLEEEDIKVQVLGPIPTTIGNVRGLKFLGNPPRGPRIGHESLELDTSGFKGKSASHTINGHSIVFRLTYGNFNFLFTGDLNDEAARILTGAHTRGELNLQAEVFKVPHHGSADFSGALLQSVSPVVSIVSSGDESARKEFIHPRSTLVGALGKFSRLEEPLIFVTELVAFFQLEGLTFPEFHKLKDGVAVIKDGVAEINTKARKPYFGFSRAAFGIVQVRTDGQRLFVYTNSGQADLKEAYAYAIDPKGKLQPAPVLVA